MKSEIRIRKATKSDIKELYRIGKSTPELKVSDEVFMSKRDFEFSVKNKEGLFLLAEERTSCKIIGFAYAAREAPTYAALVYAAVLPEHRGKGVGKKLIQKCIGGMKTAGARSVYCLVTNNSAANLMRRLGFNRGKTLIWMNRNL